MLAPLDNEVIFKKAFTDKEVLEQFVFDLFGEQVEFARIETEKSFDPPIADIHFKLDIYAESVDHRVVIEIQRIDYDYNFNRFLSYFLSLFIEQQKRGNNYAVPQTVLGVVVLTQPYRLHQLNNEPIKDSVLSIDFDPRNLHDERILIWKHQLLFLNPNLLYKTDDTPRRYQDWLDLFALSVNAGIDVRLNIDNRGIAKTRELIEFEKLDPREVEAMKVAEAQKAMALLLHEEGKREAEALYEPLIKEAQQREAEARQREEEAQQREAEAQQREIEARQRAEEARRREQEALEHVEFERMAAASAQLAAEQASERLRATVRRLLAHGHSISAIAEMMGIDVSELEAEVDGN